MSIDYRSRLRGAAHLAAATLWLAAMAQSALTQQAATLTGTVSTIGGAPLAGVLVSVEPGNGRALTDVRGAFRVTAVPTGSVTLSASRIGYLTAERIVAVAAGGDNRIAIELEENALQMNGIVVSVSREAQRLAATPASVGVVSGDEIRRSGIAHPGEAIRRVPGAWVSVTSGEGHQTAIRQPLTTNPVYLYLEDGIPTRSTGFFNHNALYEMNLPQAERIEITRGPVTALYGSDAIGGIVNVGTRAPSARPRVEASAEAGSFGWQRLLASASGPIGDGGLRAEMNLTRTDGWRDDTGYERQSGTIRWDRALKKGALRTVATFSNVDQQTAGSSALREDDFETDPTLNYTPISFRRVRALRLSSEYSVARDYTLFSIAPFVRWNEMELLANWPLTYDPTIHITGHRSVGLLLKARHDLEPLRARAIAGVDIDYSPGFREEAVIDVTREGRVFTDYSRRERIYDYDVTYRSVSPYMQLEASPTERFRLVAGLRLDVMGYTYDSRLAAVQTGKHRRPENGAVNYRHLSPKLGATYEIAEAANLFVNYGHGFRAPSEGQLFRQGQALNTVGLEPVKVDSYEAGLRGAFGQRLSYDVSVYHMTKSDDIVVFVNPDGSTENLNAGGTLHRGVELGMGLDLFGGLRADLAYSRARHTYEEWTPRAGTDLGGKEMEVAPRTLVNSTISYAPGYLAGGSMGVEWTRVGSYWMDAQNTNRYHGHHLLGLRASIPLPGGVSLYGRIANLANEKFAESATYTAARGREFAPGAPRTLFVGLQRN